MSLWRTGLIFFALIITMILTMSTVYAQEGTAGRLVMEAEKGYFDNWGVSYFSIGGLTQKQVENGGSSFGAYNYIGMNYKLGQDRKFSIRPVFNFNTSGVNKYGDRVESDTSLGDLHLVYSDYALVDTADLDVSLSFKVYLPTSDYAQNSGMITKIRPETYFIHPVGLYSTLSYIVKPDFYVQSHSAYDDDTTPKRADGSYKFSPRKTTQLAGLEHYVEYNASLSRYFSLKPSIGFMEDWYNGGGTDALAPTHNTYNKVALALDIRPASRVTFTFGAENKVRISDRGSSVAYFRPEENNFYLMTNASL